MRLPIRVNRVLLLSAIVAVVGASSARPVSAAEPGDFAEVAGQYEPHILPLVTRFCADCHNADTAEAEINLAAFARFSDVRHQPLVWKKVREMLQSEQMPPMDSEQPSEAERKLLEDWVRRYLAIEAKATAGDPGPVVLRRLNNAQYTNTIRELTDVDSLNPVSEFPVDGAAGEGFTNTGAALVMSPGLVTKYLDAAKEVAAHAVLLPDGLKFSPSTSRRDWINGSLARIREFYARHTVAASGGSVVLQGIKLETNQGGRIPLEAYFKATLENREALAAGKTSIAQLAVERSLNAKYLATLWSVLTRPDDAPRSVLIDDLRNRWRSAKPEEAAALAAQVESWQSSLWKANLIGQLTRHLGGTQGPAAWLEPVSPVASRKDVRMKLASPTDGGDITLYLTASDAGDGNAADFVVWENPRLVVAGRPDLPLRDVRSATAALAAHRQRIAESSAKCLAAAAEATGQLDGAAIQALAAKHEVDPALLAAWLETLGIRAGETRIDGHLTAKSFKSGDYEFVQGWSGPDALGVLANSSDQHVRIPGNMPPHSVAVHPAPTARVVVGWQSPVDDTLQISGIVQHAHPECGNGTAWSVELRRGTTRQLLAGGNTAGATLIPIGPVENFAVRKGDVIALVIAPREANHSCDLTTINLALKGKSGEWDLAREVSPSIVAANPAPDAAGHAGVWHFYSEPDGPNSQWAIPAGSLLARWQSAPSAEEKQRLASELQTLLQTGAQNLPKYSPDAALARQLGSLTGPFASAARAALTTAGDTKLSSEYGLDPTLFGKHPAGKSVDSNSLCVQAPAVIEVRLPAELVEGCEFVTAGVLHPDSKAEGSVQLQESFTRVEPSGLQPTHSVIVGETGPARERFENSFAAMRDLFPAALCYTKIVPVDEVVTLNLYYREDDHLKRLMLDDQQAAELDRLWDELFFVAQEPLQLATAFEQLLQFATQDRPDKVEEFTPMKGAIAERASKFSQRMVELEPVQVEAAVDFARRAYRRPLRQGEAEELRAFYASLRQQEMGHEEALRLTIARVLVSPEFLYRIEEPGPGSKPRPVSGYELATRLSYFLWSSPPDDSLLKAAAAGNLTSDEVLRSETLRMLGDRKARRLATEFAAQWLHIYDFDQHDEKSERHFPEFAAIRGAMYEESIQFFADLFQHDGSVLDIVAADYTFLNEDLARLYGVPDVAGPEWRRVDGMRKYSRGGILTQASILAKQAGASRTSGILRGNWFSEVVLGEKLPKPPKDVPQLADAPPEGLTERQLIEKHSTVAACAKCHIRIDPFGFALENFDAIGRFREKDATGLAIDSNTKLKDGTPVAGLDGLRKYLLDVRKDDFVRQFNKKLLGYALGRGVRLSDEPLLDEMQRALAKNDYRVSAAVETIVLSPQFREIRGSDVALDD